MAETIEPKEDILVKTSPDHSKLELKKSRAIVKREGDRVVIENVPRPMGPNSVLACFTSILMSQGEDVSYEFLMGVSSRAFRLQFSWCPSAPHAFCGFNTFEPALKATGYEATKFPLAQWEPTTRKQRQATEEEVKAVRKAVRESIDRGVPCLMDSEESAPIIGYEPISDDNKTGWIVRHGFIGPKEAPYSVKCNQLPWELRALKRIDDPIPSRLESVIWSLRAAVENARKPKHGGYDLGFAAFERWIKELGNLRPVISGTQEHLDKYDTDESAPFGIQLGNAWCHESLIDARKCASQYLRDVSSLFGEDTAQNLQSAADAYDQVVDELTTNADGSTVTVPYPWDKDQKWTQEKRDKQAARLKEALKHERKAVTEIEQALTSIDEQAGAKGPLPDGAEPSR